MKVSSSIARPLDQPEHRADGPAVEGHRPRQPGPLGEHLDVRARFADRRDDHLDHPGTVTVRRVDHHWPRLGHREGEGRERGIGEAVADLARFGVAVEHRVDDVVHRAGADRVVGRVADHEAPCQLEEGRGPRVGGQVERGQRLRLAFERALGAGGGLLDVDPVGGDSHQQVRPRAGAELAAPAWQALARGPGEIVGQRGDRELEVALDLVDLREEAPEPRLGAVVVGAVHEQHRLAVPEQRSELVDLGTEPAHQRLCVVGERRPVAVAGHEVLGSDLGSVGCLPVESGAVDRGGHSSPDDRVPEPGLREQLGHLGDVAEHVGQVADVHHPAERRAPLDARLQVADDRLPRHEELVHEDVPGSDGQPTGRGERAQSCLVAGTDLEVVVDHRHLAVEQEVAVRTVLPELVEEVVDQLDQPEPEGLERLVPLAVPVGVGHDRHRARGAAAVTRGSVLARRLGHVRALPARSVHHSPRRLRARAPDRRAPVRPFAHTVRGPYSAS